MRLIDADALRQKCCSQYCTEKAQEQCLDKPVCYMVAWLDSAPTIKLNERNEYDEGISQD